jgi:hypothetical protein
MDGSYCTISLLSCLRAVIQVPSTLNSSFSSNHRLSFSHYNSDTSFFNWKFHPRTSHHSTLQIIHPKLNHPVDPTLHAWPHIHSLIPTTALKGRCAPRSTRAFALAHIRASSAGSIAALSFRLRGCLILGARVGGTRCGVCMIGREGSVLIV